MDRKVNAPKNIEMSAGEDISISAGKNITVSAGENLAESAGNDITQDAKGNINERSDNRTERVEETFNRKSLSSSEVSNEAQIFSDQEDMTLQSGQIVMMKSAGKSNLL
jgi:uncharacterized protein (DUF2345 family)